MRKLPHFLDRGDHCCAFYKNEGEKLRLLIPFFRAGLLLGEKCLYVASHDDFQKIQKALRTHKSYHHDIDEEKIMHIDASIYSEAAQSGSPADLCEQMRQILEAFMVEGYKGMRGAGCLEMDFTPVFEDFILEYERLVSSLFKDYPVSGICLYPHSRFNTSFGRKIAAIDCHPVTVDPLTV